jgi:hypothetical protein
MYINNRISCAYASWKISAFPLRSLRLCGKNTSPATNNTRKEDFAKYFYPVAAAKLAKIPSHQKPIPKNQSPHATMPPHFRITHI